MTIVLSTLTPGGIVMAGEGRTIKVKTKDVDFRDTDKKIDFEPLTDNTEKVHLIADRFGLAYSGLGSYKEWCLHDTINEFNHIVRLNLRNNLSFNVQEAGGIFNGLVQKSIPPGAGCEFFWAGYSPRTGKPFQVCYRGGQDVTDTENVPKGWRTDIPEYPDGCYHHGLAMLGRIKIISDFLNGKKIRWSHMSLRDATECVAWLLSVGTQGLKFFEGEQQLSGGGADILAITPNGAGYVKNKALDLFREGGVNVGA